MKYLELPSFRALNSLMSRSQSRDVKLNFSLEAYLCKQSVSDRQLAKSLDQTYLESVKSPNGLSTSPFGPLSEVNSRKTFMYLIATLNSSFPDHDFSSLQAEEFHKEHSYFTVINSVNTILSSVLPDFSGVLQNELWTAIDHEIRLQECSIYSYLPDPDADPFGDEAILWSFYYFFFNKKLKRVVFLRSCGISKQALSKSSDIHNFLMDEMLEFSDGEDDDIGDMEM